MTRRQPESLVIRPPSEWRSLLVRVTRGCAWNRCKFCGIYPHLGQSTFSIRSVEEIKEDITLLRERRTRVSTAFLGDADPLLIGTTEFIAILEHLKRTFPEIGRITCYARASTIRKRTREELEALAASGLSRVHIGLESGDDEVLKFHRKGLSARIAVEAGQALRNTGIEVSFYVLLGLGGRDRWREHMDGTVNVLRAVNPEFVRIRRLWLYQFGQDGSGPECPLWEDIRAGRFLPQTPEGTVFELKRLLEGLEGVSTFLTCDHANNYVRVEGRLPEERQRMLDVINAFLQLPESERQAHYEAVGSQI